MKCTLSQHKYRPDRRRLETFESYSIPVQIRRHGAEVKTGDFRIIMGDAVFLVKRGTAPAIRCGGLDPMDRGFLLDSPFGLI